MASALFFISLTVMFALLVMNRVSAETTRTESTYIKNDVNTLLRVLSIYHQQTCNTGVVDINDLLGVYIPNLNRVDMSGSYTLEIIPNTNNVSLSVSVALNDEDIKFANYIIADGAQLNGNQLRKVKPYNVFVNSQRIIMNEINGVVRASNC